MALCTVRGNRSISHYFYVVMLRGKPNGHTHNKRRWPPFSALMPMLPAALWAFLQQCWGPKDSRIGSLLYNPTSHWPGPPSPVTTDHHPRLLDMLDRAITKCLKEFGRKGLAVKRFDLVRKWSKGSEKNYRLTEFEAQEHWSLRSSSCHFPVQ